MQFNRFHAKRRAIRSRLTGAVVLLTAVGLTGCDVDSLVDLPDPDLITLPTVQDPDNVNAVRNGALFEFARAVAGPAGNNQTPGLVGISGLLADEMWYSSTFTGMREIDRRAVFRTNVDAFRVYQYLHRARNLAEAAEALLAASEQADSPDRGRLLALSGYVYVLFSETWCGNVPFSKAPLGEPLVFAAPIGTSAMLDSAIVRFDRVINGSVPTNTTFTNLARLGKARALQNQGNLTAAAAVAAEVPTDFVYDVEYNESQSGQNNGVWYNLSSEGRTSVATEEGTNGLLFFDRGTGTTPASFAAPDPLLTVDPRVPVDSAFGGTAGFVRYVQFKYTGRGSDIPLGTGVEARLIEAEADLNYGATVGTTAGGNWLQILNDLRDDAGIAADLTDPGNNRGRVELLYRERAFWLWLTAHRQGDLRRLARLSGYNYDANTLFPIGPTIQNEARGTDVAFPIPIQEANNPLYDDSGCVTMTP